MAENQSQATFTIFVNNIELTTVAHELTGAQIKGLASIPDDYELFEVLGNSSSDPIPDNNLIHIHQNLHFRAIPSGTFGQYVNSTPASD
jgi:hypothetical protein